MSLVSDVELKECAFCTHSLRVNRVHSEEERRDEGQVGVLEGAAFAGVHEQAGDGAVQTHVDDVEVEGSHAAKQDVQSDGQKRTGL